MRPVAWTQIMARWIADRCASAEWSTRALVVARSLCDDAWAAREFTAQSAFSDRFERLFQRFIGRDLVIQKRGPNGGRDYLHST
jgi:hypothetical protein